MAIAAAAVIVPLSLLFFISGLVINLFQAVSFVLIWPLPKNTYRKINRVALELLLLEIIWFVDWWAGVKRSGCLGSVLAVMKKSLKFFSVIGRSKCFSEYLFLEQKWAKDENTFKTSLKRLKNLPRSFWLALFIQGTHFTQTKFLAAQEYAISQGLPIPRNVLVPCTKGFVTAVSHLRSFVLAIYDITVAIPKTSASPTLLRLFNGQSSVASQIPS